MFSFLHPFLISVNSGISPVRVGNYYSIIIVVIIIILLLLESKVHPRCGELVGISCIATLDVSGYVYAPYLHL